MKLNKCLHVILIYLFLYVNFYSPAGWAGEQVAVKRVVDGDTIELTDGLLVRYIGVNAPEINHERHTAEPFGLEARMRNDELVGGRRIRLELDAERLYAYGRTLAYVFLPDGSMVNEQLLRSGLSYCLYKLPNVKYEGRLLKAQREAMRARIGLWSGWRETGTTGGYVGNRNSRRFHLSSCPEVKRISPQNRIRFSSRWDAFWSGYAPSKECLPEGAIPSR
ncbi:MAG: thermonuclease family protein [Hyphomicrobiales bacterium]